jgi:hypothetical protein
LVKITLRPPPKNISTIFEHSIGSTPTTQIRRFEIGLETFAAESFYWAKIQHQKNPNEVDTKAHLSQDVKFGFSRETSFLSKGNTASGRRITL